MASTIGIKIADGEFYSIVDENSNVKKRLVLTTVHDNQQSVQIDLYKSHTRTMSDALYVGSLVVEDIRTRPKGEPSIELIVSCDAKGHIDAEALDLDTGSGGLHQYLNVSLKSLDDVNRNLKLPDFELEQHEGPPQGLYERALAKRDKKVKQKKVPWALIIILGASLIVLCLVLFFLLHGRDLFTRNTGDSGRVESVSPPPEPPPAPEPPAAVPSPVPAASAAEPAVPAPRAEAPRQPPPVIQAPAQPQPVPEVSRRRNPPVASYKVPAAIPRNGAPYRIRWGDTLWDISAAFYRDPWLYPRIARYNGIRNPDLIISGSTIRIPPKN
ncbi:MAG: LysM peptidoglycan-binding domain-containing protein [Treponema sp.]|jgi:hypothetical protein|nr:LysM peptidoglycan-binding domain-containing protein [Treponema sp.]